MADTPLEQTVRNWMLDSGERVRALERRYQELKELSSQEDEGPVFHNVRWFSEEPSAVSGIGATETIVATVDVPAFSYPTQQFGVLQLVTNTDDVDSANARWDAVIRDTDLFGTIRGFHRIRRAGLGTGDRFTHSIPLGGGSARFVSTGTATTMVATLARTLGDGTVTVQPAFTRFTVWVFP